MKLRMSLRYALPLFGFVAMLALLGVGLTLKPREVPSVLIDRPAPAFELAQLHEPERRLSRDDLLGQVWLFNVWASWCVSCRVEHPLLMDLARSGAVPIVGLNYKDQPDKGIAWLAEHGNPYLLSVQDRDGRTGMDYGVYGVPETFVIDRKGRVRHKVIGPLTPDALRDRVLPLVEALKREA